MKILIKWILLTLMALGCANKKTSKDDETSVTELPEKTKSIFTQVADFPTIKDTGKFIAALRQTFELHVHESPVQKEQEKITVFKKVKLYGSDKDYIFIEYDWKVGSMADFPWKHQLLLTTDGELVKVLSCQRYEFVAVFPNQNPFLLIVQATAKGNGGHELYKISSDTLENVYKGYSDYNIQTYDAHEDRSVFEPNELKIVIKDQNKDGLNDILFTGQQLMLGKYTQESVWFDAENGKAFTTENPASKIPIQYIFLYDKQTGHFKPKQIDGWER